MTKLFVTLPALALVVALSSSALAENGAVSTTALQEMGLAGIEVMSDDLAMEIRGKGWKGGKYKNNQPSGSEKPWTIAYGSSYASIGGDDASAGSIDGFIAEGKYMAAGEHFSEAGKTVTETSVLEVKGLPATLTIDVKSIRVFSGGFSSSSSL